MPIPLTQGIAVNVIFNYLNEDLSLLQTGLPIMSFKFTLLFVMHAH